MRDPRREAFDRVIIELMQVRNQLDRALAVLEGLKAGVDWAVNPPGQFTCTNMVPLPGPEH